MENSWPRMFMKLATIPQLTFTLGGTSDLTFFRKSLQNRIAFGTLVA